MSGSRSCHISSTSLMAGGFWSPSDIWYFVPGTHVVTNISMGYKEEEFESQDVHVFTIFVFFFLFHVLFLSSDPNSIASKVREAPLSKAPARLYCVAPLQLGPLPLVTYDFWLIGKECCQVRLVQVEQRPGMRGFVTDCVSSLVTDYDGMSFAAVHCFWEASKPGFNCGSAQHLHSSGLIARRQIWNVDGREVLQKSSVEMVPMFRNMATYDISNLVLVWITVNTLMTVV